MSFLLERPILFGCHHLLRSSIQKTGPTSVLGHEWPLSQYVGDYIPFAQCWLNEST